MDISISASSTLYTATTSRTLGCTLICNNHVTKLDSCTWAEWVADKHASTYQTGHPWMELWQCSQYRDYALGCTIWGSIPSTDKRFFSSPKHWNTEAQPAHYSMGIGILSLGNKPDRKWRWPLHLLPRLWKSGAIHYELSFRVKLGF